MHLRLTGQQSAKHCCAWVEVPSNNSTDICCLSPLSVTRYIIRFVRLVLIDYAVNELKEGLLQKYRTNSKKCECTLSGFLALLSYTLPMSQPTSHHEGTGTQAII